MGWIGITDRDGGRFSLGGFGHDIGFRSLKHDNSLLTRGTFLLETRMSPDAKPQDLFSFRRDYPWERSFALQAIPGGGLALVHKHGTQVSHAAVQFPPQDRTDIVRASYTWDSVGGWARLILERPDKDHLFIRDLEQAHPFLVSDVREAILGRGRTMAVDMVFAAVSSRVEPVGPMPSLGPDTPILTPSGYRPVSQIGRGDTVLTPDGVRVPVMQKIIRTVPARGNFTPIRLQAPYLGLASDVIVSPDQRLVLTGSDVEYVFGRETVLVTAKNLIDGRTARWARQRSLITYHQLVMPRHEVLDVAGAHLESAFLGRLRRDPDTLAASLLAGFKREDLPEHNQVFAHEIRPFEAITLLDARAA